VRIQGHFYCLASVSYRRILRAYPFLFHMNDGCQEKPCDEGSNVIKHVQRLHERQAFTETNVRELQQQMEIIARTLGVNISVPTENTKPDPLVFTA